MPLPLSDIKVVDFCTVLAGPFSSMMLADQGADVVKIESPGGDGARRIGPVPGSDEISFNFLAFNRNKRAVALDITQAEGRDAAYRLIEAADVFITNMRVDTRRRRGFTYEDIVKINPRVIYVSLTGYGDDGPESNLPGADITLQARIGDIAGRRVAGEPPPNYTHIYHFDMAAAITICYGVLVALRERDRTGLGQKIEASLLQTGLSLHAAQMTRVVGVDASFGTHATGLPQIYRCKDGRYILDQYINLAQRWDTLAAALQLDELNDPRFATLEGRQQHVDLIHEMIARHMLTKTAPEWEAQLKAANHLMSMIRDMDEVFDDPQVLANEMLVDYEQPGIGQVKGVGVPFRLASTAAETYVRRPAPRKDEHTDEVLLELGYGADQLANMRASGAIGAGGRAEAD